MPECHSCPVAIDIANGAYRGIPFEQTPCAKCLLAEPSNHGRSHISMQAGGDQTLGEVEAALSAKTSDPEYSISALAEATKATLSEFIRMDSKSRDIACWRLLHPAQPLRDYATEHGISIQAVHYRIRLTRRKYPLMRQVLDYKHRERDSSGRFTCGNRRGFKPGGRPGPGRGKRQG